MTRITWVDNAKAICIFLVVLGHFSGLSPIIKEAIYAFHIPAFLFMTGYFSERLMQKTPAQFFKKGIIPYVLVYALFSVLALAPWYAADANGEPLSVMLQPIAGIIYGVQGADRLFMHHNGPLWYLPFLISVLGISFIVFRQRLAIKLTMVAAILMFALFYHGMRLPWAIDVAGIGVFFLFLGSVFKKFENKITHNKSYSLYKYPLLIACLTAIIAIPIYNGGTNINRADFGHVPLLSLAAGIAGMAMIYIVSNMLPPLKIMSMLAANTILIFCTHIYPIKVMNMLISFENTVIDQFTIIVLAIFVTLACLIGALIVSPYFNRFILLKSAPPKKSI